jgi:N-acetylmuramoyl-L-alanine amidase
MAQREGVIAFLIRPRRITFSTFFNDSVDHAARSVTLRAVVRFRIWLTTALVSGVIVGSLLYAQTDDEEKSRRDESEQVENHSAPSPNPKKSPSPVAKTSRSKSGKKHREAATPEKAPTAIPHAKLANEESEKEADSSAKEKKSRTPSPKAKSAKEESTSDDNAGAQEPPRSRKAAPKSDDEEEARAKPTPRETPEASASKSKRHHTPTPKSKKSKELSGKTKKAGKSKSARKEEETPKPEKTPPASTEQRAAASERPTPAPKAVGAAAPTPAVSAEQKVPRAPSGDRAQVVIEKSGLEEDQGLEPPPSPPPRRGFWPWSRSSGNYRYLTRSVIDAIRRAPVKRRRWQFIVVHNSGTRQGNARVFDYYHRHVRRMQNGLAYHFVIGNGTSTGNGQIEVGDRWRRQINGGHVHSDYLNNISLGICLVGDFNRSQPTRAQLDSCEELIRYLRDRCGKTDRGAIPVRPHREMNPPRWATDCPGDDFPYSWFRRF